MEHPLRLSLLADVVLPLPLAETYTYSLPESLQDRVRVGCRVIVPFGAKKIYSAIVVKVHRESEGFGAKSLPLTGESEGVSIALLPDHPTPVAHRTHTNEPIPFCIFTPGMAPDSVQTFDEVACQQGAFGLLQGDEFIKEFMSVPLNS